MNIHDIHAVQILPGTESCCLMDQEIRGTRVNYCSLKPEESICFAECSGFSRILIILSGTGTALQQGGTFCLHMRDVLVQQPQSPLTIRPGSAMGLIELQRSLTENEFLELSRSEQLPYYVEYDLAPTYREDCKSEKTVSRMLIPARVVPNFAMGSVQTAGVDRVEKHSHPMLEQYFFGMADNNCVAMIDDVEFPFGPNTLLHIPLGSDHGILSAENQTVHYYWMDFLFGEEGLTYMDTAHTMNEN